MNWTTQKPSIPGWYEHRETQEGRVRRVWIYREGTGDLCAEYQGEMEAVADMRGEFRGPLFE